MDAFNGTQTSCPTGTECPPGVECYNDVCLRGTIPEADMVGTACAPNRVVNFADVSAVIDAFHSYPFTQSPGCAEVCTGAALPLAPANPYYFTGRRLDVAGGPLDGAGDEGLVLYHYRARAYDARHGRFLQRDPAGYRDSMNLYEYVRSNPQVSVDPSGLGLITWLEGNYQASDWEYISTFVGSLVGDAQASAAVVLDGAHAVIEHKEARAEFLVAWSQTVIEPTAERLVGKTFSMNPNINPNEQVLSRTYQ